MEREGVKEEGIRIRKEEDDKRKARMKSWLKTKKEKLRTLRREGGGLPEGVPGDRQHPAEISLYQGGQEVLKGETSQGVLWREGELNNVICERAQPRNEFSRGVSDSLIMHSN